MKQESLNDKAPTRVKQGSLAINPKIMPSSRSKLSHLRPITSTDIYDGATKQFHPEGLFSAEIFGRLGSKERLQNYSYIDIKVPVFHPLIFNHLKRLKALYVSIMNGTAYAKWDSKLNDFVRASEVDGKTGFDFFVKHFKKIKFADTGSMQRELRVNVIEEFSKDLMRDTCIVIAAGARDVVVEEDGRTSYDEINDLYKKLIAISNTIVTTEDLNGDGEKDLSVHDKARWNLQYTMVEIYDYLFNIVFGKNRLIQSKWASRTVFNGSRNVLTSITPHTSDLDEVDTPEVDAVQVGLYQTSKGMLPVTTHMFVKGWPSSIIDAASGQALLINPKTLKPEQVTLKRKTAERWGTSEGVNKMLNSMENIKLRSKPVMVDGKYLGLIYSDDKNFRLVSAQDIENETVPKEFLDKLRPVTWVELIYCLIYIRVKSVYGIVTRYPISGTGSTYPAKIHLKTTTNSLVLSPLDEEWNVITDPDMKASSFPVAGEDATYFDSIAVSHANLGGLGADYDGD